MIITPRLLSIGQRRSGYKLVSGKFIVIHDTNFILAIFGLTVQFIVNATYKRFVKPNKF